MKSQSSAKEAEKSNNNNGGRIEVECKLFITALPKCGMHLARQMATPVLMKNAKSNWTSSHKLNSWGREWTPVERCVKLIESIQPGAFCKGHLAHRPEFAQTFLENKVPVMLLYRDLRDVAVSQTYHILKSGEERWIHPGAEEIREGKSFDEVLRFVIEGNETYPGLFERWALYAPWLEYDWVLKLPYEELRLQPRNAAGIFVRYLYGRTASMRGFHVTLDRESYEGILDTILENMADLDGSPTFRKGEPGNWQHEFSDDNKQLFKEHDKDDWLIRLGYANDRDW